MYRDIFVGVFCFGWSFLWLVASCLAGAQGVSVCVYSVHSLDPVLLSNHIK